MEERVRERTVALEQARQELASVLNREVEVQEKERIRIANELHDSVIQALVAVIYQIQGIKQSVTEDGPASPEQLTEAQQMLEMLVVEIKAIVHDLRPPVLESLGLIHAIRQLAAQFDDPPHFTTQLQVLGGVRPLSSSAERTIYRVVQEALSNSRVHSVALSFEGIVGALCVGATGLMLRGRMRRGLELGYWGLLLSLTVVRFFALYFNQFDVILTTLLQLVLMLGVLRYRGHHLDAKES